MKAVSPVAVKETDIRKQIKGIVEKIVVYILCVVFVMIIVGTVYVYVLEHFFGVAI